ncbi:mannosyltransferase putative-domain-containing protein [Phycomyces blakesleeanus]|uniref:Mannosyltransferase putative-domain-containing protein n=1 Tax=Phycomyces blakesleeanus TaxID=4837 RepID=A0ABR3AQ92_PHYBL
MRASTWSNPRLVDDEPQNLAPPIIEQIEEIPEECSTESVQRNIDHNHGNAHVQFWRYLSKDVILSYQKQWQDFIAKEKAKPDVGQFKGRGIVLVAGNVDTFGRATTTIRILKEFHHCTLPIEVWHLPDEIPSPEIVTELARLGAVSRSFGEENLVRPVQQRRDADKQFQIKAAAIINSRFNEVLYLDSDNVPAIDPTFLFDSPDYKRTGAMFWPDFWQTSGENIIFPILNIPCKDEWEQESGQIVINKAKAWLPLQLSWYMQNNHEIYFQLLNGDKDTFQYAWKALDAPFYMVPTFLGMGGGMVDGRFCGHTMLQYYPDGDEDKLLFIHANMMKVTDKSRFMQKNRIGQEVERPWQLAKRYTMSRGNKWLQPGFYVSSTNQPCMDFTHLKGEPECAVESFDKVAPGVQDAYFAMGGIGGRS